MGLSPTASVELLAHLCRDGEARGHVQPPLGHLTQVGALATQLQGRGGGRGGEGRGGEEGEVSCKQKGEVVDIIVGFKSGEGIIVGQTQKGVEAKSEAPERRLGFTDGGHRMGGCSPVPSSPSPHRSSRSETCRSTSLCRQGPS